MKHFAWALALLAMLAMFACNSSTKSDDTHVRIEQNDAYVFADSVEVELSVGADLDASHAIFYLDDEQAFVDWEKPYVWTWDTTQDTTGIHRISAVVYTNSGDIKNASPWVTRLTPVPFYNSYLADWGGITERDDNGNLTGEIDARDWLLHTFGNSSRDGRPVFLSRFAITSFDRVVIVEWTTETEDDIAGFHLWRGESNDAWNNDEAIRLTGDTMIPGAGNSNVPQDYTWVDTYRVEYRTYWYWLQVVHGDDSTELFSPVEHTVEPWSPDLENQLYAAWPNPAVNSVNLGFECREAGYNVTALVIDSEGEILETLLAEEPYNYGQHALLWDSSAYTQKQLRIIYYFERATAAADTSFWGYGDVYVQ